MKRQLYPLIEREGSELQSAMGPTSQLPQESRKPFPEIHSHIQTYNNTETGERNK